MVTGTQFHFSPGNLSLLRDVNYSTFDRELLAVYLSIKHFRYFLEGRCFHVVTDHKPLIYTFSARTDRHSPRQARHLDYISQFTTDLRHIRGIDNPVADALSRIEANAIMHASAPLIDYHTMAKAQRTDPELTRLLSIPSSSSLKLAEVPLSTAGMVIFCDMSTEAKRPFVPATLRRLVFDSLHSLSHPGIRATQHLITSRFVWPSIKKDVRRWTRACSHCQRTKITRHTFAPPAGFKLPDARFDVIHIDLVGPLPPSRGYTYLLTCVDRFTRWPEAFPLVDITADSVAQAFVHGWIARFGVPSTIVTDRGRQFESNLWDKLMQLLGSCRQRTTAYHPQSNGMVERLHRQLKAALKCQPQPSNWMDTLPLVLLGVRSALKEDFACTAAELVYGTTLRLPGEFLNTATAPSNVDPVTYVTRLKAAMQQVRAPPVRDNRQQRVFRSKGLDSCTHVFVRHDATRTPLQAPYDGSFRVVTRTDKYFTVERKGKADTISVDRLKPAFLDATDACSAPPILQSDTLPSSTPPTSSSPRMPISAPASRPPPAPATRTTRAGRHVHWPKRLDL